MLNVDLMLLTVSVTAIVALPLLCLTYFISFQIAIKSALKEQRGEYGFNRLGIVACVVFFLGMYYLVVLVYQIPLALSQIFVSFCIFYLVLEIPYQLVKYAAKSVVYELESAGDDKRELARESSASTLADIISEKLSIPCELQAFTSNEEFIFLTYIVNNKPIATRLKIAQADKPENWKKLGDWIIQNYQKEASQAKSGH